MKDTVSQRQTSSLVALVTNFDQAIRHLPTRRRKEFHARQRTVASKSRRAQMSDRLLRFRLR